MMAGKRAYAICNIPLFQTFKFIPAALQNVFEDVNDLTAAEFDGMKAQRSLRFFKHISQCCNGFSGVVIKIFCRVMQFSKVGGDLVVESFKQSLVVGL